MIGRPLESPNEAIVRADILRREEEANQAAQRQHRQGTIATIRMRHREHGMSRKRLVDIYGQSLVDQALG